MVFPSLVRAEFCRTPVTLDFDRPGLTQYGAPHEPVHYEGNCNYQDKARTVITDQKKRITINGTALFPGDICPELPVIAGGKAVVFGTNRQIVQGRKNRNPDGTVNYTEVWLE